MRFSTATGEVLYYELGDRVQVDWVTPSGTREWVTGEVVRVISAAKYHVQLDDDDDDGRQVSVVAQSSSMRPIWDAPVDRSPETVERWLAT